MCTSGLRRTLGSVRWWKLFQWKKEKICLPLPFFSMEFISNPIKLPMRYLLSTYDYYFFLMNILITPYIYWEKRKEFAAWAWRRRWNSGVSSPNSWSAQLLCAITTILVIIHGLLLVVSSNWYGSHNIYNIMIFLLMIFTYFPI